MEIEVKNTGQTFRCELIRYPKEEDWLDCKVRTLVTIGLNTVKTTPNDNWKGKMLLARHSPIRDLRIGYYLEIPYWVSTHLVRHHIGVEKYVQTQRNDRQTKYDRHNARQGEMVKMIMDFNGESIQTFMHKRLCNQASEETRIIANMMKECLLEKCPEFADMLVPACAYNNGVCREIYPCNGKE